MRYDLRGFLRRGQFPLAYALALLPVTMLCCQGPVDGPGCIPQGLTVLGCYLALALVCLAIPGRFRLAAGAACAVALGLFAWFVMPHGQPVAMIPAALCIVLLLWGLQMAAWKLGEEPGFTLYAAGVVLYLIYYAMLNLSVRTDKEPLNALLLAGFLGMMLLTLLSMNRSSVAGAAISGKAPPVMRRINTVLTVLLMLLVTLIAAIPALTRWAVAAWEWLKKVIMRVVLWVMSLMPDTTGSGVGAAPGGSMEFPGLSESTEPSAFAVFLERAMFVGAALVLVLLLVLAVRGLWRLGKRLFRLLTDAMQRYAEISTADYRDEIESTLSDGEREQILHRRPPRRPRRLDEARLTPREKVRYRYQRALWEHADWSDASTARDHLAPDAAALYERARYSEHEVSAADAEGFAVREKANVTGK